jgi:hypothetical protein
VPQFPLLETRVLMLLCLAVLLAHSGLWAVMSIRILWTVS